MGLLGFHELKSKLERYCAYQERSPFEVKKKLTSFTSDSKQLDKIMASLIKEGFLNQERFLESYVQGKINQKRWGKSKIKSGLIQHRIPAVLIKKALDNIEMDKYLNNMTELAVKKEAALSKQLSPFEKKMKVVRFLYSKGYSINDWQENGLDRLFPS